MRKMSQLLFLLLSLSLSLQYGLLYLSYLRWFLHAHDGRAGFNLRTGSVDAAMDDWAMKLMFFSCKPDK